MPYLSSTLRVIYIDRGNTRVGINNSSPTVALDVTGAGKFSAGLTVTASGLTVTAGGLTITAGGLTVTAGGLTVTAGGLTVTAGGLTVTAGGLTVTAGGLTVTAGDLVVTAGAAKINTAAGQGLQLRVGTVTNLTTAGDLTYTAAQIATGIITRDPNGAGRTDTTDTATNLVAAAGLGLTADGDTAIVFVINTADAAEAITFAGGTGVTISNVGQTVGQNESAILLFRRTGATAITLYILGA